MRSRTSLPLMEMLVMILVFALAAALCLQVFAKAGEISAETAHRDRAVNLACNAAQLLKATGGHRDVLAGLETEGYRIQVTAQPSRQPRLEQVQIRVFFEERLLFTLNTGWQEELP